MSQSSKTNQKTIYYWAVQGTIVEFAKTDDEASALMQKAGEAEQEEMGEDFDCCDSIGEYAYTKEVPPRELTQDSEGRWKYRSDVFSGSIPDWVLSQETHDTSGGEYSEDGQPLAWGEYA